MESCVVRWNQMNMQWEPTLALVAAHPCSIRLAYSFPSKGTSLNGGKPCYGQPEQLLLGPKECIDTTHRFPCTLNTFGATFARRTPRRSTQPRQHGNAKVGENGV